jgi:hypothetical protein
MMHSTETFVFIVFNISITFVWSQSLATVKTQGISDIVLGVEVKVELYLHFTFQILAVTLRTARFNIHKSYVLPTQCIYVFRVDLRTNSDYFPIQR